MAAVKICGITDESAIKALTLARADYAGFVFFQKSPRHLSPEAAANLRMLLPPSIQAVSVLVNPDDTLLGYIAAVVKPHYFQLHGHETPTRVGEIKRMFPSIRIIKALPVSTVADLEPAANFADADMLMFDAKPPVGQLPGGNALAFDWKILNGQTFSKPWILSGGLTPENVATAITQSGATMVDVSSGVERTRGVKDSVLIREFITRAKDHRICGDDKII